MTLARCSRRALFSGAALCIAQRHFAAGAEPDIRVLVPNTLLGQLARETASKFAAEHDATVAFIPQPPESIEFLLREDVRTSTNLYQAAVVPMWHLGGFVVDSVIQPLDDLLASAGSSVPSLLAEYPSLALLRRFDGRQFALPIDGDCQLLYFQNDVLESDATSSAFASATGQDLGVPETWSDLLTIAEWSAAQGDAGIALPLATATLPVLPFVSMAATWATPPDNPGIFWFESDSFAAAVASENHQNALQEFARLVGSGAPEQLTWNPPDAWNAFLDGEALFTIAGPDLLTSAIDRGHPRRDRIGIAPLPVSSTRSGTPPSGTRIGNALGPCWSGVVQANAPDPMLALQAITMLSESDFQIDRGWVVDDGIDPSSDDQLPGLGATSVDQYTAAGFSASQAGQFAEAIDATLSAVLIPYLRIPGALDYLTALDRSVTGFLHGEIDSAAAALESAAAAFDRLSDLHGVDRQRSLYFSNL